MAAAALENLPTFQKQALVSASAPEDMDIMAVIPIIMVTHLPDLILAFILAQEDDIIITARPDITIAIIQDGIITAIIGIADIISEKNKSLKP
jgi:hypothetical protein